MNGWRKSRGVGFTFVDLDVSISLDGPKRTVRVLVATGAGYCMIPREILLELKITPAWRQTFTLADGRPIEREVGYAFIHYGNRHPAATHVIFGEPGDEPVLGAYGLQGLELEVDPYNHVLRAMRTIPLVPIPLA
ncbi:MAG: hypothetical protein AABY30_04740 [Candidatus Thermoplasmatota archaeon]